MHTTEFNSNQVEGVERALKGPYAPCPVYHKFPKCWLWHSSTAGLTDDGPLSSSDTIPLLATDEGLFLSFDTVPLLVWLTMVLSRPLAQFHCWSDWRWSFLVLWHNSTAGLTDDGPFSSFDTIPLLAWLTKVLSRPLTQFHCWPDWRWPFLVLSRKINKRFTCWCPARGRVVYQTTLCPPLCSPHTWQPWGSANEY